MSDIQILGIELLKKLRIWVLTDALLITQNNKLIFIKDLTAHDSLHDSLILMLWIISID